MDGRLLSKKLMALGFKPEKSYATRIRGWRNYHEGDYKIYTEKSFGLYGLNKRDRARYIECSDEVLPIVERILAEHNVEILYKHRNQIVTRS